MGQLDDGLACGDDLSGFGQRFNHHAIGIGDDQRIACRIDRDIGLGEGRIELGLGGIGIGLGLIVARHRDGARRYEIAIALFIGGGLERAGTRRIDRIMCGLSAQTVVGAVDAHQGLTLVHHLPRIDEAFDHLAGDAKAQIALHPR
jgi:hypothetical protein